MLALRQGESVIRPLPAASEEYPALGRVEAMCSCGDILPLSSYSPGDENEDDDTGCFGQLVSTILTCDDPAEVGEMCKTDWILGGKQISVTARLFLWKGDDIWSCYRKMPCFIHDVWPRLPLDKLTAVVLVGESKIVDAPFPDFPDSQLQFGPDPRRVKEAAQACAEAGVQFVIPGDTERGRLKL